ncbi:hypothetical protein FQN54_009094 [Arachnomyces sp. PD_36]|nr:hypothetical protein FQN54_009094 [Arachnomyces sp. PD_36]
MPSATSTATLNGTWAVDRRNVQEVLTSIVDILVAYRTDVQGTIYSLDGNDRDQAALIAALRVLYDKLDGTLDIIADLYRSQPPVPLQANVSPNDVPVNPRPNRVRRVPFRDVTNIS